MNQRSRFQFVEPVSHDPIARDDPDMVDIGALARTLWRGKLVIAMTMAAAVIVGAYYAYLVATPVFRSTAVLILNSGDEPIRDLSGVAGALTADSFVVNSELEVLRSRSLLSKLVTELGLERDPEFNRFARTPSVIDSVKLQIKRGFGLTTPAPPLTAEQNTVRTREATIDGLLETLTIRNVPQSLVFEVTVQTEDPAKSARVANTLAGLYIQNQRDVKFDATKQATVWMADRVSFLRAELEDAETKIKVFRGTTDLVTPASLAASEYKLKELREQISDTERADVDALARIDAIKSAPSRENLAIQLDDAQLTKWVSRLDRPAIATAFDARVSEISERATLQVQKVAAQLDALKALHQKLEGDIARQRANLLSLQNLTREAEASRLLYDHFLARLKETSAQQGVQQPDARLLSVAVVPTLPASPKRAMLVVLVGLGGLLIGITLVLLRDARKTTFRTTDALRNATGYPVMGQIGILPGRRTKRVIAYLARKPMSAASEALRNLRTSLLHGRGSAPPKVIVLCSSLPGEGKTTMSVAMAQNIAAMGKRVLLIEGDVRRRAFKDIFSMPLGQGLVAAINQSTTLSKAVHTAPLINADVLMSGKTDAQMAELFSTGDFETLLDEARQNYDHIIIDTPPVLVVPDARIVAQFADAVLFVVKWDVTKTWQVEQALSMLGNANRRVTGLVLNQINSRKMRRYGEHGQHYDKHMPFARNYYVN